MSREIAFFIDIVRVNLLLQEQRRTLRIEIPDKVPR